MELLIRLKLLIKTRPSCLRIALIFTSNLKKPWKNQKKVIKKSDHVNRTMDKEKFKQFIVEVAEIKELKPVTSGERPADGETEVLYNGEWITLDKRVNPTLGFKFIKLKSISPIGINIFSTKI